jgi:capsular polysaccharide biosynthesis protein
MEQNKTLSSKNILTITLFGVIAMLVALGISLWQTPKYKSSIKLLTVFNQTNIDVYTASKTANYITGVLGEVIYSDTFIESVIRSGSIEDNLGYGSENRQKNWKRTVKTTILENKGIIIIETYSDKKIDAIKLAEAVGNTIIKEHCKYDGSADRVSLKMIDNPTSYDKWSTFKIMRDTAMGLVAGLLFGLTFIVIFPGHRLFEFKRKQYVAIPGGTPTDVYGQPYNYNPNENYNQAPTGHTPQSNSPWLAGHDSDLGRHNNLQ